MAVVLVIAISGVGSGTESRGAAAAGSSRYAEASVPPKCPDAVKAIRFYSRRLTEHRARMGLRTSKLAIHARSRCPQYLAHVLQRKAYAWRVRLERWLEYQYAWRKWLPDKWQRIGACETGYGQRPGNWRHRNSAYEGAFGFAVRSWDQFKYRADPKAGPYPEDAWQATPRQQYEVALAIYRAFGFSGWGCRGA